MQKRSVQINPTAQVIDTTNVKRIIEETKGRTLIDEDMVF